MSELFETVFLLPHSPGSMAKSAGLLPQRSGFNSRRAYNDSEDLDHAMRRTGEWELNFDSAPFCNGSLHLGHVRNYVLGDVWARWLRKQGVDVSYVSAFDAFGLPNEVGSYESGIPVDEYVSSQIATIARQCRSLHLSYSNPNLPRYCDPAYYRWTQWLFLRLWDEGLIYNREQPISFCPACDAFLADTQNLNGRCWRCAGKVVSRFSAQWYIRTTAYADRLFEGIDGLHGWSPRARRLLRSFMGRLEGVCTEIEICEENKCFRVRLFTNEKRLHGSAFLALRSDHPLGRWIGNLDDRISRDGEPPARSRRTLKRQSIETRFHIDLGGSLVPVTLYPSGDLPNGMDAILVPASDAVDRSELSVLYSRVVGSYRTSTFRVQDWLVSRNRSWGTPMPIVDCPNCGPTAVADDDLPVRLSTHGGDGHAECRSCGESTPTMTRVLDCFFDDAWCFFGASRRASFADNPFEAWRRNPPDRVHFHAGYDTFVYLHVFRFIGYFLYDLGYASRPEPIDYYQGHDVVTAAGRKMSKRHKNAPDLDSLLDRYGADAVRLSILSTSNPGKPLSWTEDRLHHGMRIVETIRRLMRLRGRLERTDATNGSASSNPGRLQRIYKRIHRVDLYIEQYRVGAAIDQLYVATGEILRLVPKGKNEGVVELVERMLTNWGMFAPETVEGNMEICTTGGSAGYREPRSQTTSIPGPDEILSAAHAPGRLTRPIVLTSR